MTLKNAGKILVVLLMLALVFGLMTTTVSATDYSAYSGSLKEWGLGRNTTHDTPT